jgi:hypothetical protein
MNLSLRQILPPTYTISFAIENDNLCPEDTILPKYSVQIANSKHYYKQKIL